MSRQYSCGWERRGRQWGGEIRVYCTMCSFKIVHGEGKVYRNCFFDTPIVSKRAVHSSRVINVSAPSLTSLHRPAPGGSARQQVSSSQQPSVSACQHCTNHFEEEGRSEGNAPPSQQTLLAERRNACAISQGVGCPLAPRFISLGRLGALQAFLGPSVAKHRVETQRRLEDGVFFRYPRLSSLSLGRPRPLMKILGRIASAPS
jgi:hypothetical protein